MEIKENSNNKEKGDNKKGEWNNAQGRRVIHSAIAHYPLRDGQPSLKQQFPEFNHWA